MSEQRGADKKTDRGLVAQSRELGGELLDLALQQQIARAVKDATWDSEGTARFAIGFIVGLIIVGVPGALIAPFLPMLTVSILGFLGFAFAVLSGIAFARVPRLRALYDIHQTKDQRQIDRSNRSMNQLSATTHLLRRQMEADGMITPEFDAKLRAMNLAALGAHHKLLLAVATDNPAVRKVLADAKIDPPALGPSAPEPDPNTGREP